MQRARVGVLLCEERKAFYRTRDGLSKTGREKHKRKEPHEAQNDLNPFCAFCPFWWLFTFLSTIAEPAAEGGILHNDRL
jgi:hypothetical protein